MRGIEIRDGKPIFYSLGNLIFQNETVAKMPADFYERYKLDPFHGTPADAYDIRQKAPPRLGYPIQKWFTDDEKFWLSVTPSMVFEDDRLTELKLHPIELGQSKPRSQRGRPVLAVSSLAEKILHTISELSKPYGTKITVENGVGIAEL
jgi:poly-gamma-glutamate synthesis protein (capsule biosynthesis protein)